MNKFTELYPTVKLYPNTGITTLCLLETDNYLLMNRNALQYSLYKYKMQYYIKLNKYMPI